MTYRNALFLDPPPPKDCPEPEESTKPGLGGDDGAILDQWNFVIPGFGTPRANWAIGDPPDVDFATEGITDQSWSLKP